MNINISVFLFVIFLGRIQAHGEKRILLNDPDLIHSQIQALESKYQDILTKYADLSTKYTDVSTKYADLSMKYTDVSTKNTALATKFADLSAHNADLAVKYHHLSETSNEKRIDTFQDNGLKLVVYSSDGEEKNVLLTRLNLCIQNVEIPGAPQLKTKPIYCHPLWSEEAGDNIVSIDSSTNSCQIEQGYHFLVKTKHPHLITLLRHDIICDISRLMKTTSIVSNTISGFAGGSWYNDEGGAAEYVCLPRDPNLATKFSGDHAKMYGSEYNSLGAPFGLHDGDDVPCAVCRSSRETSVLMIPGKNSCYTGWAMQYHGYLVAGYYAYKGAGQYICLDEHPETLTAGGHDEDGKLIYPVQAVCGSLPCPPYENGKYLTCAVCAK